MRFLRNLHFVFDTRYVFVNLKLINDLESLAI